MSLIPTVYRSTDAGAPALSGQSGALTTLLDAALVDGYGTGPSAKAPAGWTRAFTASNKRAFRNSPVTGTGTYVRVDDDATSPGNARHAWVRSFKSMSDIDTGLDPAPTAAQLANGIIFAKSDVLSSAARPWMILANERFFYLLININDAGGDYAGVPYLPFFAGDTVPVRAGDQSHFFLCGSDRTSYTGGAGSSHAMFVQQFGLEGSYQSTYAGYFSRSYDGAVGAAGGNICRLPGITSDSVVGSSGGTYPNPAVNGLLFDRCLLRQGPHLPRAYLPNVYAPIHDKPFLHGQLLTGLTGMPEGTELLAARIANNWNGPASGSQGQVLFDLTNQW